MRTILYMIPLSKRDKKIKRSKKISTHRISLPLPPLPPLLKQELKEEPKKKKISLSLPLPPLPPPPPPPPPVKKLSVKSKIPLEEPVIKKTDVKTLELDTEKSKHIEMIKRILLGKVKENDKKLKKEISQLIKNLNSAIKGIDRYEYILTSEYDKIINLHKNKINNIKIELRSNVDVEYDMNVLKAKIKGYMELLKTNKTTLNSEISALDNLYKQYEHKANGIRVAIFSKLEQAEEFRKSGLPKFRFKEKSQEKEIQAKEEISIPEHLEESYLIPSAKKEAPREEVSEVSEISKDFSAPLLETKILEHESKGNKGLKKLFKKYWKKPPIPEDTKKRLDEITTNVFDLTQDKHLKEFFNIQKSIFDERVDEKKKATIELKEKTQPKRKEVPILKKERMKKQEPEGHAILEHTEDITKIPGYQPAFDEIQSAIHGVKIKESSEPEISKEYFMQTDRLSEDKPETRINYELDEVYIINRKINEARDALLSSDLDIAKQIYLEILRSYNQLSVDKKKKVYEAIKELYDERKSAERVILRGV